MRPGEEHAGDGDCVAGWYTWEDESDVQCCSLEFDDAVYAQIG